MRMPLGLSILVVALAVTSAPVVARGASGGIGEPAFTELLANAQRDMGTEKGAAYDKTMGAYFEDRHTDTVAYCVQAAGKAAPEAFDAVIVVEQDGTVARVAFEPETEVAKCLRTALLQERFPQPPFAPFHDLMRMSFK